MIFYSRLELKNVKAAVSEQLGFLPKTQGGDNSARVWVKTASSATIIVFLVYSATWCGGSAKCDGLYCGIASSVGGSVVD